MKKIIIHSLLVVGIIGISMHAAQQEPSSASSSQAGLTRYPKITTNQTVAERDKDSKDIQDKMASLASDPTMTAENTTNDKDAKKEAAAREVGEFTEKCPFIKDDEFVKLTLCEGVNPWLSFRLVLNAKKSEISAQQYPEGIDETTRLSILTERLEERGRLSMVAMNLQGKNADCCMEYAFKSANTDLIKFLLQAPIPTWNIIPRNWRNIKEIALEKGNSEMLQLLLTRISRVDAVHARYAINRCDGYEFADKKDQFSTTPSKPVFTDEDRKELAQALQNEKSDSKKN